MSRTTASGTKFSIGTIAADPASDTFTAVGEITDMGDFGREYKEVTTETMDDRKTFRVKGNYDDGTMTITLNRDMTNAGQTALAAALNSDADYNFRIELNNKATEAGHGTRFDFKAKVFSFKTKVGGPNSFVGATVKIGIEGAVTETAAA